MTSTDKQDINMESETPLLSMENLKLSFYLRQGVATAINNLDLSIYKGKTLGLVGESGCGKSVTSLAIMGLVPHPGKIMNGSIHYNGTDLLKLKPKEMRKIRGNSIAMIFQDPMTGLNPVLSIGKQLTEGLLLHRRMNKKTAVEKAEFMLEEVGIPNPSRQMRSFPHELSGGMRQRVMIAMALINDPELLIADEPTTALDVTIQAQIIELMKELQEKYNTGILFITHDLGVIAEIADDVAVMYAGDMVEYSNVTTLFDAPTHPYTRGLMKAIPNAADDINENSRLYNIPGNVPTLLELPQGCRFQDRCPDVTDICRDQIPDITRVDGVGKHLVRCVHAG